MESQYLKKSQIQTNNNKINLTQKRIKVQNKNKFSGKIPKK